MTSIGQLRTTLDNDLFNMFQFLKEYYGLKNNSEMLRYLIKKEYVSLKNTENVSSCNTNKTLSKNHKMILYIC